MTIAKYVEKNVNFNFYDYSSYACWHVQNVELLYCIRDRSVAYAGGAEDFRFLCVQILDSPFESREES